MSSNNKDSSSDLLAAKTPDTTANGTTAAGQNGASQVSLPTSNSESQNGGSMLQAWATAPASSDPWSAAKATLSPR
ncbi:uncharacterized protein N7479_000543 [Penicillium vulpinum]|uniref:Uncharacterized protein n=1 Tax=Penicillium vulpinum TaxID=29845 RepID=A0A1V6S4X9_9EURO|nr:uncharacterized protein N7479_000543 [Penicillium vulpinum]KAJ5970625.1 hypothetical protein N7479_000543 [Penicillium vulpinum]OQE09117.1 hypothetical protein PENVUL_c007G02242 [Penicillium vulpinum]